MDAGINSHIASIGSGGFAGGYDAKVLKNYAAMSATAIWPGWDHAAGYAAAYNQAQANALAAAASTMNAAPVQSATAIVSSTANIPQIQTPTNPLQTVLPLSNSVSPSQSTAGTVLNGIAFPAHSTTTSSPKKKAQPVPEEQKDDHYWERRKRNNDSARRSRESRRMKEEQIAVRVVYLEQENLQLRTEVSMLRAEIEKMRMLLYNTAHH